MSHCKERWLKSLATRGTSGALSNGEDVSGLVRDGLKIMAAEKNYFSPGAAAKPFGKSRNIGIFKSLAL